MPTIQTYYYMQYHVRCNGMNQKIPENTGTNILSDENAHRCHRNLIILLTYDQNQYTQPEFSGMIFKNCFV